MQSEIKKEEAGFTLTLSKPVQFGSEAITQLTFREPVGRDFRDLNPRKPMGMVLDLAALMAGVSPTVIDSLCAADTMTVFEKVSDFLPGSQKTGETL